MRENGPVFGRWENEERKWRIKGKKKKGNKANENEKWEKRNKGSEKPSK